MGKRLLTDEQHAYFKQIAVGKYAKEIAEEMYETFGITLNTKQISLYKRNHGIRSGVPTNKVGLNPKMFTDEQETYLKSIVSGRMTDEIAALVNEKYNLQVTPNQIRSWKQRNAISSGVDACFKPGQQAWNKGIPFKSGGRSHETWFKTGQPPINWKPVGSERVNVEGYLEVKTTKPGNWELKHRVVYREHFGEIPEGHAVVFNNRDRTDCRPENLLLVSRAQLAVLNKRGLLQGDAELNKTAVLIADVIMAMKKRRTKA
jgi:hypothetical protein